DKPADENRSMPYSLIPARYEEEIEVNLPEDWNASSSADLVTNPNFLFSYRFRSEGSRIRLNYQYQTLKDHVAPAEMDRYLADYRRINESVAYEVSYKDNLSSA